MKNIKIKIKIKIKLINVRIIFLKKKNELAWYAATASKCAGVARESSDESTRPEPDQILPRQRALLVSQWRPRLSEIGSVHEQVAFRSPLPFHPLTLRRIISLRHLLGVSVVGRPEPVSLADDGGVSAASDGVQLPVGVVVVHHVDEPPPAPGHALDQPDPESVEGHRHLHDRVNRALLVRPQQHHVVVVVEFAVGDGHGGRPLDHVDQPIGGLRQGHVVDPHVVGAEHRDGVAVALRPQAQVVGGVSDHAAGGGDDVVDPDVVYDDVLDELKSDSGAVGDVDLHAPAVDGLVAGHD